MFKSPSVVEIKEKRTMTISDKNSNTSEQRPLSQGYNVFDKLEAIKQRVYSKKNMDLKLMLENI